MSKRLIECVSVLLSIGAVLLIVPPDGALGKNTPYYSVGMLAVSLCFVVYLVRSKRA